MLANDKLKMTSPKNDANSHMKYQTIKKAWRSRRMRDGSNMIETTEPIFFKAERRRATRHFSQEMSRRNKNPLSCHGRLLSMEPRETAEIDSCVDVDKSY